MTYERTMETRREQRYFITARANKYVVLGIENGSILQFGTKKELDAFIQMLQHAWGRAERMRRPT